VFGRLLELSQTLECKFSSILHVRWANQHKIGTTPRAQPNAATPVALPLPEVDPAVIEAGYAAVNERIAAIHKGLPPGTALCIMSGNSDPRIMSGLNAKKARWDGLMRERKKPEEIPQSEWWTMEEGRLLEDATERAKRGLAFFCLVR
jgi:hypothetical protein